MLWPILVEVDGDVHHHVQMMCRFNGGHSNPGILKHAFSAWAHVIHVLSCHDDKDGYPSLFTVRRVVGFVLGA